MTCKDCLHEWACMEHSRGLICKDFVEVHKKGETHDDIPRGEEEDMRIGSSSVAGHKKI